ncbi:MAG: hypothetical protein HY877_03855 [Deltaproteobacteria bacterium]|nr:hypothetical protein [Deltaproteobacteria bacterium]
MEIQAVLVDSGVGNSTINTFSERLQQYTQAALRQNGEAQRQILRSIAEGFSQAHYEQARPRLLAVFPGTHRFAESAQDALDSLITLPPDSKLMQILESFDDGNYTLRLYLFHLRAKKALTENLDQLEFLKQCGIEKFETQADVFRKKLEALADPAKLKSRLPEKLAEIQKIERAIEDLNTKELNRRRPVVAKRKPAPTPREKKPKARVATPPPILQPPVSQLIRELFVSDNLPSALLRASTTGEKWNTVEQKVRDMSKTHYRAGAFFNRVLREGKVNGCLAPEEAWALLEKYETALPEGKSDELNLSFERIVYYRALTIRGRGLIEDVIKMLPRFTTGELSLIKQLRDELSATLKTEEVRDIRAAVIKLEFAIRNLEGKSAVFVNGHWKFSRFSN